MEAVGILVSLESQIAVMTGGRDREEHPLIFVSAPVENVPWSKECLDELLRYYISILSVDTRQQGITVIVDAQRSTWRLVRLCTRQVTQSLGNSIASIFVLRPDAFWDKQRVDNCAKIHKEGEPIYIPLSRLNKYVESSQLLPEYGGTWIYNHDRWIQNRIHVEEFVKNAEHAVSELERLRQRVGGTQRLRLSTAEEVLMDSAEMYDNIRELTQQVLTAGAHLTESLDADYSTGPCGTIMPQDILDTKEKIDRLVEIIEGKMILVQQAWIEMQKTIVDIKEVQAIEEGVQSVTDWILGPGETMLNCQKDVGHDITSAEELRRKHESLELECRNTYGHYAELLHKIDTLAHNGLTLPEDLKSQRDFMDFVCRSFASRLERRRNILITSARFFRLVSEYFQTTSDVYESLVMYTDIEALETAHCTLLELQESQMNIDLVETALVREGEKLSDLLSMPVKDALGRELLVDYTNDIINVREILDMTTARRQLFRDSVELQRLTLQQATHIHDYEKDAEQAIQWLDDLFQVMLRDHSHVGCNVSEIQLQKEEHQAFQETAKGTYEYGCQLLNAALSLRQSCKLPIDSNTTLSQNLWDAWKRLYNVVQEQLTRLRVSAVFHRSVQEHCRQLGELIIGVKNMALEEDVSNHRAKFRKFLSSRERLLLEVGRMVRLGRLLRTRLREPLCQQKMSDDGNTTAVEAISEKLAQVTGLAEELDAALCGSQGDNISLNINKILDGTASTTPEEWYSSLSKGLVKCGQEDSSKSEEDFVTASECTCTPPSRSSSFHTASEGETSSPWWEVDPASDQEHDVTKEPSQAKIIQVVVHQSFSETRHLKLSRTDGCSETTESVLREYCTDDASKSPQKVEDIITSVSSSDTISSVCQDVSEVISGNTEDVSSESSTVLQQMRQSIMPTFYKRKVGGKPRGEWDHDRLREAINRIQKDGMRFREAERYYRVPARTIERRMTTGNLNGPTCSLGPENEERLVKHIHRLCDAGFCPDKTIVHHVAYEFVVRLKINHKFNNEKKISRYVGFGSFFEGTPT